MKVGSLVTGIILLFISVIGFTSSSNTVAEQQTTVGEIERFFSQDAETSYQTNQFALLAFGGLGVIGLGLLVYGAAAKGKSKNKNEFYCKYCGFTSSSLGVLQAHVSSKHENKSDNSEKKDDLKNIEILKERLAKGEITKEEYKELKKEFE